MGKEKEIRFAVGSRDDLRSSVWRLWGKSNDLFLTARSMAGESKISFHASGMYRYAIVSQTPRLPIYRWTRPAPSPQGVTLIFNVIVPPASVDIGFRDVLPPPQKRLELVDAPIGDATTIISVLLTEPDFREADVLTLPSVSPTKTHGRVNLTREAAWLVSYSIEYTPEERSYADGLISSAKITVNPGDNITAARLLVFKDTVPPSMIDLYVGPENIYIGEPIDG